MIRQPMFWLLQSAAGFSHYYVASLGMGGLVARINVWGRNYGIVLGLPNHKLCSEQEQLR